jgi:dolichol-phosphate mannosyltransferase
MDADLQHPPELLETLLRASRSGVDFVVASRYLDGGRNDGLDGWHRRAVSKLATWAAKCVLRPQLLGISDPMSGFFLVRRSCLDLPALHPQGFKLLLELLVSSPQASVAEVPYVFTARHSGASKAGLGEGLTYLRRLAELRVQARRAPRRPTAQDHQLRGSLRFSTASARAISATSGTAQLAAAQAAGAPTRHRPAPLTALRPQPTSLMSAAGRTPGSTSAPGRRLPGQVRPAFSAS